MIPVVPPVLVPPRCSACGTALPAGARTCPSCGAEVPPPRVGLAAGLLGLGVLAGLAVLLVARGAGPVPAILLGTAAGGLGALLLARASQRRP